MIPRDFTTRPIKNTIRQGASVVNLMVQGERKGNNNLCINLLYAYQSQIIVSEL
jgi:hypothetical protein